MQRLVPFLLAAVAVGVLAAASAEAADTYNGRRLAERWCAACHAIERNAEVGDRGTTVCRDRRQVGGRCRRARLLLAEPASEDAGHRPQPRCGRRPCGLHCEPAPVTRTRKYSAMICISVAALIVGSSVALAGERAERGRRLLSENCATCHALGRTGQSPLPAAPPMRRIGERVNLDDLAERMREGLSSGHRDMPMFRFSRADALAIRSYLTSIQDYERDPEK